MARHGETQEERLDRKAAKKAVKEARRLQRQGLADNSLGQKPCTICHRPRDLLVRCQKDATGTWHMACGRCWVQLSGGQVDGAPSHPHYRYGGLWKNHHQPVSGKNKVPKGVLTRDAAVKLQEGTTQASCCVTGETAQAGEGAANAPESDAISHIMASGSSCSGANCEGQQAGELEKEAPRNMSFQPDSGSACEAGGDVSVASSSVTRSKPCSVKNNPEVDECTQQLDNDLPHNFLQQLLIADSHS